MGKFKGSFNVIGLGLYGGDIYSDITLAIFFFNEGHYIWGYLTIIFVIGPLILANISAYYGVNEAWWRAWHRARKDARAGATADTTTDTTADNSNDATDGSTDVATADDIATDDDIDIADSVIDAEMYEQFGILSYRKFQLVCCCTLTLPLALMINSIPDVFRGKDNDRTYAGQGMKLLEVYSESLPQSLLQGFVIAQVLQYGDAIGVPVDWKQWTSLGISITSLSFSIATSYMSVRKASSSVLERVKEPSSTSKVTFFLLGGLTLSARILVCSLWALISKPLWAVPFACNMVIAVIVWCVKQYCRCDPCVRLDDFYTHRCVNLSKKGFVILTWVTTGMFNGFTTSGALVSACNLGLAIASYFLVDVPVTNVGLAGIIAIALSSASFAANLLLVLVPALRRTIGNDWLLIGESGRSTFY